MSAIVKINDTIDQIYSEVLSDDPGDHRVGLLKAVISSPNFNISKLYEPSSGKNTQTNNRIISELLKVLENQPLKEISDKFKTEKKKRPSHRSIWNFYDPWVRQLILDSDLSNKNLTFISVGCGSGSNETQLHNFLTFTIPDLRLNRIGLDTSNYINRESILSSGGKFVNIGEAPTFTDAAKKIPKKLVWVFCDFAAHHILISPENYISKCPHASKLILLEQLVHESSYQEIEQRIARIGYDLISNALSNPEWIKLVYEGKAKFEMDIWTHEEAGKYFDIINFPQPHSRDQILYRFSEE